MSHEIIHLPGSRWEEDLKIINFYEYILSHEELAKQPNRGDSGSDNTPFFKMDLRNGVLDRYKGTFVAYHKGVLCGQSKNKKLLYQKSISYYGNSDLAVFMVPKNKESLEEVIKSAIGQI